MGLCICLLLASGAGWVLYRLTEPRFAEFRQQQVLSKSEIDSVRNSASSALEQLSNRVQRIERNPPVTVDDLERLKFDLERELQTMKAAPATSQGTHTDALPRNGQ